MSKFISKKYQLAFEDVTGTLESTVIEETGLSVDNVIEGLNNDIELQEAGKEYKTNRDKMEEALEVVSGLELLKEKNDELIANGEVTGDDVLASQEALCQASAILGLNIQTLSFENIAQDPKQALVLSNEGIIESIDKGIEAIIKFFKNLFSSIWKFITGLFSSSRQIELTNNSNIKKIDSELISGVAKNQEQIDRVIKEMNAKTEDIINSLSVERSKIHSDKSKRTEHNNKLDEKERTLELAFVKYTSNKTKIGTYCKLFGYDTVDFQSINKLIDVIESMSSSKKLEEFNKAFMFICDSFSKYINSNMNDDYNKYSENFLAYIKQAKSLGNVDNNIISILDKHILSKNSGKFGGVRSVKEGIDRNTSIGTVSGGVKGSTLLGSHDDYVEASFNLLSGLYYSLDCDMPTFRHMTEEIEYSCKLFYLVNNPYVLVDSISITGVEKLSRMNYELIGKINLQDCKKLLERINNILNTIDNMNKDIYKYETFEKLFPTEAARKNWSETHEKWVTNQVRNAVNKVSRINVQGIKNLIDFYKIISSYCNAYIKLVETSKIVVEAINDNVENTIKMI